MQITIHRGTHEIGGSCVEIKSKEARILLDFGLPLDSDIQDNGKQLSKEILLEQKILPDIESLYDNSNFDALLISHAHSDHYGLLNYIDTSIPLYMSKGCETLIQADYLFKDISWSHENITIFNPWETFRIKDIVITPYLTDH